MLTSSSLSSASSSSSSSSFSFSFSLSSSSSLHRRPHTVRSTQTGKFRRCGNYVSRRLNFRLRRSTRGGVVNASAPRVADVGRRDAPGVRNGSWCSRTSIFTAREFAGRAPGCDLQSLPTFRFEYAQFFSNFQANFRLDSSQTQTYFPTSIFP